MASIVKSRSEVTFVLVFFTALAIAGILAGSFFVRDFARARASAAWPTADAVVLSQIDESRKDIRYAYSFEGRTYQSTRDRVFIARVMKPSTLDYAPGEAVTTYVDPKNPSYSVLRPGGAGLAFVFLTVMSGVCVFFGLGGVIWTFSEGVDTDAMRENLDLSNA